MRPDLLLIVAPFFILLSSVAAAASSKKATTSTLHFYMHDIVGTSNDTTVAVATSSFKTAFGMVTVMDDKLTEGPSLDSKQVGRAQGAYFADSLSELSLLFNFAVVFDNGTLSFHGQDPVFDKTRELSVIGGTGAFRFATGYAVITTYALNGLYAILDVNVFLRQ